MAAPIRVNVKPEGKLSKLEKKALKKQKQAQATLYRHDKIVTVDFVTNVSLLRSLNRSRLVSSIRYTVVVHDLQRRRRRLVFCQLVSLKWGPCKAQ